MALLHILYEHAAGYALFKSSGYEGEEFLKDVQKEANNINGFKNIVSCLAFQPFRTGRDALENINCISEGIMHSQLQEFLENNIPKSKKKKHPVILGVSEPKLAASISEKIEVSCTAASIVGELIRGIRYHFHELVDGLNDLDAANKAQLGLGHHYSRARVKFNVNRIDNMIIQSISLLDQLDKDINTFTMRVREWYSHHFPELIKVVSENALFIQCIRVIRDRKEMPEDVEEKLEEILQDPVKVQKVLELSRSSMGMDISSIDLENVYDFAERIISLTKRREELKIYLRSKMHSVAPNLAALIGDVVGARLIAHAGSLINLAKYPASTVQILGAEKALFRALKTRGNTPKYGLIFHSKFIGKAAKSNKGRISRYLANKCSVASRIDCFRDIPTDVFGLKLRAQVEERLKFYETGDLPKKNVDAMMEAMEEAEVAQAEILKQMKKAKKKKKKHSESENDSSFVSSGAEMTEEEDGDMNLSKKERKKKRKQLELENESTVLTSAAEATEGEDGEESISEESKKKKKKRKHDKELINGYTTNTLEESLEISVNEEPMKKKKKLSTIDTSAEANELENGDVTLSLKKKKKKKKHDTIESL